MAMNWSHFEPEFLGKQKEDPDAHLLRTIDWMDTQHFATNQQVRIFHLTLTDKAGLWYQYIQPFQCNRKNQRRDLEVSFMR